MTRGGRPVEADEVVSFSRPPDLPGVEVLSAESSRRLWKWHHTTVSICTAFKFEGAATYHYRGRLHTARANGLCVMEPGEVHVTREVTAPATFRVLFVPPQEMERAAAEVGAGVAAGALHFSESVLPGPKLVRAFQRLHAALEFSLATPMERQERFAVALRLLLQATQHPGVGARADLVADRGHLRRAREFVDQHAATPVGLDDVASAAGVSRFALIRLFLREVGMPPHAYKVLKQVGIAREVLQQGAGLDEGARRAGFFDVSHLNRHFKRVLGVTPGAYVRGVFRGTSAPGVRSRRGEENATLSHQDPGNLSYVARR